MVSVTYFSELAGKRIEDIEGEYVGILADFVLAPMSEKVPEVSYLVYFCPSGLPLVTPRKLLKLPWKFVNRISRDEAIYFNVPKAKLRPEKLEKDDVLLGKSTLDKQLVDTDGLKVVRVNDIALGESGGRLLLMSFDVGIKGILRRIGLRRLSRALGLKDKLVPWHYVQPLGDELAHIHVRVQRNRLKELRPADIAAAMIDLDREEKDALFATLDTEKAADIFELASPEVQQSFLATLPEKKCCQILEKVAPNKAAMILRNGEGDKASRILNMMGEEQARLVRRILSFRDDTAGSVMRTNFVAVPYKYSVAQVARLVKSRADENIGHHVLIVDDDRRFIGVTRMRDLLIANRKEKVLAVMTQDIISAPVNSTIEQVADLMEKYETSIIPLVDNEGKLQGVVYMVDIVDAFLPVGWKKSLLQRFFTSS